MDSAICFLRRDLLLGKLFDRTSTRESARSNRGQLVVGGVWLGGRRGQWVGQRPAADDQDSDRDGSKSPAQNAPNVVAAHTSLAGCNNARVPNDVRKLSMGELTHMVSGAQ
jgi:hypothetical protein